MSPTPTPSVARSSTGRARRWFPDFDIWIRDTWREPALSDGRAWRFWQCSDRHRLAGYAGQEPFIDLDVFVGSQAEWEA